MQGIGSKGGKKDLKQVIKNVKKAKQKQLNELDVIIKKKKIEIEKKEKEEEIIRNYPIGKRRKELIDEQKRKNDSDKNKKIIENDDLKKDNELVVEKKVIKEVKPATKTNLQNLQNQKKAKKNDKDVPDIDIVGKQQKQVSNDDDKLENKKIVAKSHGNNDSLNKDDNTEQKVSKKKNDEFDYLETEIIRILDITIKDNIYQLKQIDSLIYAIQQKLDDPELDEEDYKQLENELNEITENFRQLEKQLLSLEKTFDLDFPVTNPDNYLIYLIDNFKDQIKDRKVLSDKLKDSYEYKTILEKITELETSKDKLLLKVEEKKNTLGIQQDELEKLNNNVISIEEQASKIKDLVDRGTKDLEEIKLRLAETVHITEKMKTVTKYVNFSLLELLLMTKLLKRNLSFKSSAVCTVSAMVTLKMLQQLFKPKTEVIKVIRTDVKDYRNMIEDCINDTGKLLDTIEDNMSGIESLRYTFKNDYKDVSHLPIYKEVMSKLNELEIDLRERYEETKRLTKDVELQLEANDAKVLKYGSLETN